MANIDLSQFRSLYTTTAMEYVKKLEDTLAVLRQDPSDKDSMNEMYISSHSLKSQSLLMGYTSLADTALALEKTFRSLKEGVDPVSEEVLVGVTTVVHAIRASLSEIIQGKGEVDLTPTLTQFRRTMIMEG